MAQEQEQDGTKTEHQEIEGYVRVSQSTAAIEQVLVQLRWGMMLGGAIVTGLTAAGVESLYQGEKPIATPHLEKVAYPAPRESKIGRAHV